MKYFLDSISFLTERKLCDKQNKECKTLVNISVFFLLNPSQGITNDFYEEKIRQYDLDTAEIDEKIKRVEKVESSFYVTAGYIIELTKNSSKLFEVSKEEERRLLIKTVLLNITWDGEKLYYDYNSPFDLIVKLNESTDWGG